MPPRPEQLEALDGGSEEPPEPPLEVAVALAVDAPLEVDRLASGVRAALAGSPYRCGAVSVAIVDDAAIHELNRQFLDHDYATDVLSFPLTDAPPRVEGEIVASLDTARRCAAEVGWEPADELLLYVVHGALHLGGFRDHLPDDARAMRQAERRVLAQLGVAVPAHDPRWHDVGDAS